MNLLSPFRTIALLLLLTPVALFGQMTLRGTVTDSTSHESIIGANVVIVGTSLGAATDIDGAYVIIGIPQKVLKVRVSCVGYEPKNGEIDFSATKTPRLDFQLKPAVIMGEEVIVTAQLKGQLAAINQQVTSKTIMNVVSEEKIQELPDANAAEAIGRLPGVSVIRSGGEASKAVLRGFSSKFSNVTIDGTKIPSTDSTSRDVDLSMLSQGSLAGIELYKTLTPDQDADAIAGTINLVTRSAPSERLLRLDLKGDYNHLMKSTNQYDAVARYGERFFNDLFGVQLQGNAEQRIRSKERETNGYTENSNPSGPNYDPTGTYNNDYSLTQATLDFTDEIRKRSGGQIIFDFNTPDHGSIKLTGLYSGTQRNYTQNNRTYPFFNASSQDMEYIFRHTEIDMRTGNISLQGRNTLAGFDVDWNFSYAQTKVTTPFDYQLSFTETPGYPSGTVLNPIKDHAEQDIALAANDWQNALLNYAAYYSTDNFDMERTAFVNIAKRYSLSTSVSGELKFGGKYKDRSRWMSQSELDDNSYLRSFYNGGVDTTRALSSRFAGYYQAGISAGGRIPLSYFVDYPASTRDLLGQYRMAPLVNPEGVKLWWELNQHAYAAGSPASVEYYSNDRAKLNEYSLEERVTSLYLMNTFDFSQFATLIAGVRVEKEVDDYNAFYTPSGISTLGMYVVAAGGIFPIKTPYTETVWLPNAQLMLRPSESLRFRFAAYRALARPDYNFRIPQFETASSAGRITLVFGNPNLPDTKAWNYEVNTQIFNNTLGLVSVSVYYKKLDNLYHTLNAMNISKGYDSLFNVLGLWWQNVEPFKTAIYGPGGSNNTFAITVPYASNQPSYAWGVEFEHQMNFGFLPGYLKNIVLSYNVSLARSETNIIVGYNGQDSAFVFNPRYPGDSTRGRWSYFPFNAVRQEKRVSENQPELFANAAIGYDIGGFSIRLSLFYQGDYVQQYSTLGNADVHVDAFTKWDLAVKQEITRHLTIFCNVNDLTNHQDATSRVNTHLNWDLPRWNELYGTSVDLGIRVTL
jgi:TonB-dependent receptor